MLVKKYGPNLTHVGATENAVSERPKPVWDKILGINI